MAKKTKKNSPDTGSIIAIVLGVLILTFMILTFIDHRLSQNDIQETKESSSQETASSTTLPSCKEGEILGAEDLQCHPKCGNDGYCDDEDICYEGECYVYPYSAVECFQLVADAYNNYIDERKEILEDDETTIEVKYYTAVSAWNVFAVTGDMCRDKYIANQGLLEEIGYDVNSELEWYEEVVEDNKDLFDELENLANS